MKLGQSKIVSATKVKGGKLQLEFAEIIQKPNTDINVLGALNADDDRFNTGKPRRCWLTVSPAKALEYFGIDSSSLNKEGDSMPLDIEDPKMAGKSLHLEVSETTEANDFEKENMDKAAKQYTDSETKEVKYLVTEDDQPIFSRVSVQAREAKHSFISGTKEVSEDAFLAITEAYANAAPAIAAKAEK